VRQVFEGARRREQLERDAVKSQEVTIAVPNLLVGAALEASDHDHGAGRQWKEEDDYDRQRGGDDRGGGDRLDAGVESTAAGATPNGPDIQPSDGG
jgi:hypothetical protein